MAVGSLRNPPPASSGVDTLRAKFPSQFKEIERLGLPYHIDLQYNLENLNNGRNRIQVRDNDHVAPAEQVDRYAIMMEKSEFPPIVVTQDHFLIDGNTREQAQKKRGLWYFTAIVIEINRENATAHEIRMLEILGATLNGGQGNPLTAPERHRHVRAMLLENWTLDQIGRALGVKTNTITQIKREMDAESKLDKVGLIGITRSGFLLTGFRALGTPDVLALNNAPYRELAMLALDAGLNFSEVRGIAFAMRETGSDEGALEFVNQKRIENRERIVEHGLTGNGHPPASSILRQRLGFPNRFLGQEQELVERNPESVGKHLEAINTTIQVLTRVVELQL